MQEFISNEEMESFLPEFINIYKNRPIKNNMVNENFIKLGVPLILLNDWDELTSSELLSDLENSFYNKKNKSRDFLYFDFWKNRIEAQRLTI